MTGRSTAYNTLADIPPVHSRFAQYIRLSNAPVKNWEFLRTFLGSLGLPGPIWLGVLPFKRAFNSLQLYADIIWLSWTVFELHRVILGIPTKICGRKNSQLFWLPHKRQIWLTPKAEVWCLLEPNITVSSCVKIHPLISEL